MPLTLFKSLHSVTSCLRMLDLSGWKISQELTDLLAQGVAGECSEKVCESAGGRGGGGVSDRMRTQSALLQILTNVIVCLRMEILWAMHVLDEGNPDRVSVCCVFV